MLVLCGRGKRNLVYYIIRESACMWIINIVGSKIERSWKEGLHFRTTPDLQQEERLPTEMLTLKMNWNTSNCCAPLFEVKTPKAYDNFWGGLLENRGIGKNNFLARDFQPENICFTTLIPMHFDDDDTFKNCPREPERYMNIVFSWWVTCLEVIRT